MHSKQIGLLFNCGVTQVLVIVFFMGANMQSFWPLVKEKFAAGGCIPYDVEAYARKTSRNGGGRRLSPMELQLPQLPEGPIQSVGSASADAIVGRNLRGW